MKYKGEIAQARQRLIDVQTNDTARRAVAALNRETAGSIMLAAECSAPERSLLGRWGGFQVEIIEHEREIVTQIEFDEYRDEWALFDRASKTTWHKTCADAWAAFIAMEDQT